MDGDRGINNNITYELIDAPRDLFEIKKNTGEVFVSNHLDRESTDSNNGAYILTIQVINIPSHTQVFIEKQ